jgi:hypothetical protein
MQKSRNFLMGLRNVIGRFCANGSCGLKLTRRPDESIEEFEVRELCGRCEAQAHVGKLLKRDGKDKTGQAPRVLKFGGSRD